MVIGQKIVINLNHLQVIITAKARKQDGGYLCKCYRDFKSASSSY